MTLVPVCVLNGESQSPREQRVGSRMQDARRRDGETDQSRVCRAHVGPTGTRPVGTLDLDDQTLRYDAYHPCFVPQGVARSVFTRCALSRRSVFTRCALRVRPRASALGTNLALRIRMRDESATSDVPHNARSPRRAFSVPLPLPHSPPCAWRRK